MADDKKDLIYSEYREKVADFVFDEKVAGVFDDMIRRSVPGYANIVAIMKVFAEHYAVDGSRCYDLGCSLGAGTLAMRKGVEGKECKIVAVDNSAAMVEKCRELIEADGCKADVEVIEGDVRDVKIEDASVVVMNFVLQFLDPVNRDEMVKKIYDGMVDRGVFILSEKIISDDPAEDAFQNEMHQNFKKLCGYSDLEISQKRKALENVLVRDSLQTHQDRLEKAGFKNFYVWFECFNFISLAAFKHPLG